MQLAGPSWSVASEQAEVARVSRERPTLGVRANWDVRDMSVCEPLWVLRPPRIVGYLCAKRGEGRRDESTCGSSLASGELRCANGLADQSNESTCCGRTQAASGEQSRARQTHIGSEFERTKFLQTFFVYEIQSQHQHNFIPQYQHNNNKPILIKIISPSTR